MASPLRLSLPPPIPESESKPAANGKDVARLVSHHLLTEQDRGVLVAGLLPLATVAVDTDSSEQLAASPDPCTPWLGFGGATTS